MIALRLSVSSRGRSRQAIVSRRVRLMQPALREHVNKIFVKILVKIGYITGNNNESIITKVEKRNKNLIQSNPQCRTLHIKEHCFASLTNDKTSLAGANTERIKRQALLSPLISIPKHNTIPLADLPLDYK